MAEKLPVPYQKKFFFQTDTFIPLKNNILRSSALNNLLAVFTFFWKVEESAVHSRMDHFKKRFSARYETQEVPLLKVLDPDVGIGYDLVAQTIGENTLIDDLSFKEEGNPEPFLTAYERELLKKYYRLFRRGKRS
ncbi:MAG: lantibiotic dehydratase family protein [Tannerellaceae bacterium]|nr:lantibiotic dehydratase family protein [Tannerellaceae bacterium]